MLVCHKHFVFAILAIIFHHDGITSLPSAYSSTTYKFSTVSSVNHSNIRVPVSQHVHVGNGTAHIYIAPLALFDVDQAALMSYESANRASIVIPLILHTNEQISFIVQKYTKVCNSNFVRCFFYQMRTEDMRIVYKHTWDKTSLLDSYQQNITAVRLSSNLHLRERLLFTTIDCTSIHSCEILYAALKRPETPLGLYLEYSDHEAKEQQVIISEQSLLARNLSLPKFVLEHDVEQLLHDVLKSLNIHDNDTHIISRDDILSMKDTLRKKLFRKTVLLTSYNDENQWNLLYWRNTESLRPDRLLRLLKKKANLKMPLMKMEGDNSDVNLAMNDYVREVYDAHSFSLYLKHRHLFELHQVNREQQGLVFSLQLKPVLVYELSELDPSKSLIYQIIHMAEHDTMHSVRIHSVTSSNKTTATLNNAAQSSKVDIKFSSSIATKQSISTALLDSIETTTEQPWEESATLSVPTTQSLPTIESITVDEAQRFSASCTALSSPFIHSAIYQSMVNSHCSRDVTDVARKTCSPGNSCNFPVTNAVLEGDPCYGHSKQLHITYSCITSAYFFETVLSNQDSSGNDIHYNGKVSIPGVESIETCGKYCLSIKECVGVVYAPVARHCWLKSEMVERTPARDRDSMVVQRSTYI